MDASSGERVSSHTRTMISKDSGSGPQVWLYPALWKALIAISLKSKIAAFSAF